MRKIALAGLGAAVASVLLWASTAFACTNLATMNLSSPSGTVGSSLTVTGSSFKYVAEGAPQPVLFHWNALEGPVLGQAIPDPSGTVSATFAIPEGPAGDYVIIARQLDEKGKDQYGTPARAAFRVTGTGGETAAAALPPSSNLVAGGSTSNSGMLAVTVGVGVLGLVLFGAGFSSFVRQARRKEAPVTAPITKD